MRVGIIPPADATGEWTLSRQLVRGLRERGIGVNVLQHFTLDRPNTKLFLGSLLLKRLLNNDSLSLVHNVDNLGPFLIRHRNLPGKTVLTVHDISPVILPPQYERVILDRVLRFNFTTLLPKLIENVDLIIVDSYSTMEDLVTQFGVDKERLTVIYLGVDTSFFHPCQHNNDATSRYGLQGDFLLYVGSMSPRKNLKTLIRAYAGIFHEIPHDLALVGPIDERRLRAYIDRTKLPSDVKKRVRERIILTGYVTHDDLPRLYSAATALIFPSLYEGFGLPPLEAMACDTPVVLSNNSSLKEVAGEAGLYIENPLDSNEIAQNILEIVNNESMRERLQSRGYEQARRFPWKTTVQKVINAYDSIL